METKHALIIGICIIIGFAIDPLTSGSASIGKNPGHDGKYIMIKTPNGTFPLNIESCSPDDFNKNENLGFVRYKALYLSNIESLKVVEKFLDN